MILVTRLNGERMALNPDLIERAESTPDTVVVLVGGSRYVLAESLEDLVERAFDYRAAVTAAAMRLAAAATSSEAGASVAGRVHAVPGRPPLTVLPSAP